MGVAAPALYLAACAQVLSVCDTCTQGAAAQRHKGNSTVHAQKVPNRSTIVSLQNHIYTKSGGLQLNTFKLSLLLSLAVLEQKNMDIAAQFMYI